MSLAYLSLLQVLKSRYTKYKLFGIPKHEDYYTLELFYQLTFQEGTQHIQMIDLQDRMCGECQKKLIASSLATGAYVSYLILLFESNLQQPV